MIKAVLILLAANCVCSVSGLKDCKQSNDYEKMECGEPDKSLTCCTYKQACIGPIKIKDKTNDSFACSTERKLSGAKAMKVVLIPLIFGIMDILFIVFMVFKLDFKSNHITKMCVQAISFSWVLLLSSKAHFGIYSGFLAILVAYLSTTPDFPRWVYRIVWAMQVFQVILIFGPNEAFHVTLYKQSSATAANSDLLTNLLNEKESTCDTYYGSFFKVHDLERKEVDANPDLQYYGLCDEGWIGVVQTLTMIQGVVWMVTALISAHKFLPDGATKVEPVKEK